MHMFQIKDDYIQKGFSELNHNGGSGAILLIEQNLGIVTKIDCSEGYVGFVNCCLNHPQLNIPQFNNFQQWGVLPHHGHKGHISVEMPVYQKLSVKEATTLDTWIKLFNSAYILNAHTTMNDPFSLLATINILTVTAQSLNLNFDLKSDNVMKDTIGNFLIIDGLF
ncbi:hypothetical protein [Vibrio splendidus]|uniref:hypothetical protein n=1 Tax=Vibrio splendidus TaxID=29497 RepID=UPI0006CA052C|nr:hypothetical protein [Vibrio splendidus]KPL99276.1 hypothetical protein AN167_14020 [Vibrio splendidus]